MRRASRDDLPDLGEAVRRRGERVFAVDEEDGHETGRHQGVAGESTTTVEVGDQPYRRSSAGATRSATKQAAATSMMSRCAGANPDEAGIEPVEPFE